MRASATIRLRKFAQKMRDRSLPDRRLHEKMERARGGRRPITVFLS
jgi:hypothetical protein